MAIIKINRKIKLDDVESCYDELYSFINKNDQVDILLPKEIDHNYFGLIPSLYQFVITWVRYSNSGKLLLDIDASNETDLDALYENELLFPLVSLVWNKNEVYSKDGKTNLRTLLKPKNIEMFEKMKKVKSLKGSKLLLTTFDHLPEDRGVLPCFEINHEFIKNESVLTSNLRPSLSEVISFSKEIKTNFGLVSKHLMGIVYELMKNTYEWAREDENRVPLDPSVRGLLIRFFKKRRKSLLDDFKTHDGLTDYFESPILKENTQSELYFLEVSVFDSGIGFIDKYKSLNPTNDLNDIDILKKCLIVHNTSAKGLEKDDKGIGSDRILSILNKKGFLRIKTGNICVYRNLITHNHREIDKEDIGSMELFDWIKNSNSDYSTLKNAKGAVVTIIYPLSITVDNE